MTYEEYIASSVWKAKRELALERDGFRCRLCNSGDDLEVHHRSYGDELGSETIDDLTTLCVECHDIVTATIRRRRYNRVQLSATPSLRVSAGQIEVRTNEVSKPEISVARRRTPGHAQRPVGGPIEPIHQGNEENNRQEKKD